MPYGQESDSELRYRSFENGVRGRAIWLMSQNPKLTPLAARVQAETDINAADLERAEKGQK